MPIGTIISIKSVDYRCIKEKQDGKNTSQYDGTYAPILMMTTLETEGKDPNSTRNYPTGLVFVKKCPENEMLVEGFVEALAGDIISRLLRRGYIRADRSSCFSPATLTELPDGSLALVQAYAQGYQPLFQLRVPDQTAKSVSQELFNKYIHGKRYDYLTEGNVEQHGLSYAMMVMIAILGNYSLHSGNVLVKKIPKIEQSEVSILESSRELTANVRPLSDTLSASMESSNDEWLELHYKIIDYGASYRYMHLTKSAADIFTSLEEQSRALSVHKKYSQQYKYIPNLFESVANHAKVFYDQSHLSIDEEDYRGRTKFELTIIASVQDTIDEYKNWIMRKPSAEAQWTNVLNNIMLYTVGIPYDSEIDFDTNITTLGTELSEVIVKRLEVMSRWRRSVKLDKSIAAYDSDDDDKLIKTCTPYIYLNEVLKRDSQQFIFHNKAVVVKKITDVMQVLPSTIASVYVLIQFLNDIAQVNQGLSRDKNAFTNVLTVLMMHRIFAGSKTNSSSFQAVANYVQNRIREIWGQLSAKAKQKIAGYQIALNALTSLDFSRGNVGVNIAQYDVLAQCQTLLNGVTTQKSCREHLDRDAMEDESKGGRAISGDETFTPSSGRQEGASTMRPLSPMTMDTPPANEADRLTIKVCKWRSI